MKRGSEPFEHNIVIDAIKRPLVIIRKKKVLD